MPPIFDIKFTKPFLENEYSKEGKSIAVIAKEQGVTPSCIRRHLLYFGIYIRNRSQSQALAESSGRRINPTKGRKRRPEEIANMARGISKSYWEKTEEEREVISERLREQFHNMTDDQREKLRKNSAEGVRKAAKEGSSVENFISEALRARGMMVESHKQFVVKNESMHLDMFLPQLNLVIEVDGPTHMRPVYNDDRYEAKRDADNRKNAMLVEAGLRIIRIGIERAESLPMKEKYLNLLLTVIDDACANLDRHIFYCGDYGGNNYR